MVEADGWAVGCKGGPGPNMEGYVDAGCVDAGVHTGGCAWSEGCGDAETPAARTRCVGHMTVT